MAKKAAESAAVGYDPDLMSSGLKDDFRGKIREAVYAPWDYDGNIEHPVLAVRLTIDIEDEDDPLVQYWSAGDITAFAPSKDGEEPCEEGEVGPFAVKVGKRTALSGSTNFASLMKSIMDVGAASGKFGREQITSPSLEHLEGLDAHWNRVPQQKRSGMVGQGEGKAKDVLVVTEIYGYGEEEAKPAKKGAAAKAAPAKPAPKGKKEEPAEDEEDDLDSTLNDIIVEALADGKLKKSKIPALVLTKLGKSPHKAAAVKRVAQAEFLEAGPWEYDEDSGTLSI